MLGMNQNKFLYLRIDIMRILVTGNMGYVGPVLVSVLRKSFKDISIVGFDSGFFSHCLTAASTLPEVRVDAQHFGDMRSIPDSLLKGVDAVVHLAAISNDPMGNKFEQITEEINYKSSVNLAKRAIANGAKRFVFASSCSMYGFSEGGPRKESDDLNPLTAYARSKAATEKELECLDLRDATVTSLRYSTACGMSPRLRLDLVLNDFVACAIATNKITVLSDGSPWRPLIDVRDMSRAVVWALMRDPKETGPYLALNVGSDDRNYQVKELAHAVAAAVPGTSISINTDAPPDRRSYRVNFALFKHVAPDHQPQVSLEQSISELIEGMKSINFKDDNFRVSEYMRLKVLENHISSGRMNTDLIWSL
jgi:nucleoside-diphosphate-sugar epimerase